MVPQETSPSRDEVSLCVQNQQIDGVVQDCNISIVGALDLPQSCTKPSPKSLGYIYVTDVSKCYNAGIWSVD